jgi:hypothetical protein
MRLQLPDTTGPLKTNYASAIYGLIVSMAVIATVSQDESMGSVEVAFWAVATGFVFFLAHVYSHFVASGIARPRLVPGTLAKTARREWPMVQGSVIPAAVMMLGALGVIDEENASYVAVWTGVAALFGAGIVIGTRNGLNWSSRLIIASVNATIGLLIVALKIFVH